jgi:hypothetical protein
MWRLLKLFNWITKSILPEVEKSFDLRFAVRDGVNQTLGA